MDDEKEIGSPPLSRRAVLAGLAALPAASAALAPAAAQTDPLPSWNDGPAKQAIVEFVRATTIGRARGIVPPEERIATFDQDGTLWVEHPMYTQVMYCLDRVPAVVKAEARAGERRAVQDRAVGRPRSDRQALDAGSREDRSPRRSAG